MEKTADSDALLALLHGELVALLDDGDKSRTLTATRGEPNVWMFVGVNGVGKTTTIAKVAQRETDEGHNVVLAAADTFRAAAAEQLAHWADVVGAGIVRGQEGADPGSVVFDAMASAASRERRPGARRHRRAAAHQGQPDGGAGEAPAHRRTHAGRAQGGAARRSTRPRARTGSPRPASSPRRSTVTGVVLTKLDGTAKGGIVLAIEAELGHPGEARSGSGRRPTTSSSFEPEAFVAALLDGDPRLRTPTPVPPMFDTLADRFDGIFHKLRSRGKLTDKDIDEVCRELRRARCSRPTSTSSSPATSSSRVKERAHGADGHRRA